MIPTIFQLGPFPIHSFGLLMVCCFVVAHRRLYLSLERGGGRPELAESMIFWAAVGGLIGARVDYLLTLSENFWSDPIGAIFSGAGFVFYGGFFGGVLALFILLRRHGCPFLRYADLSASALAVGYAIGRIGCLLSGDGDYGTQSSLPWAMSFELGVVPTPPGVLVHPTPIYETIAAIFTALLLVRLERTRFLDRTGSLFSVYLVLSAVSRFAVEEFRIEPIVWSGFTQAQLAALGAIFFAVILYFTGHRIARVPQMEPPR